MDYEKHYGTSEDYDGFGRLYWLKELTRDEDGTVVVKRILSKNAIDRMDKNSIFKIQERNYKLEHPGKGGKRQKRSKKNKIYKKHTKKHKRAKKRTTFRKK